tara:strand:+ start:215 stop:475 length:261 start_codon:yes stop_codon:yes gene_type:complete
MLKRLFLVLQILTLLLPLIIFLTYIIKADGDQWTSEHFIATGLSLIPFIIVMILKFIIYGQNKDSGKNSSHPTHEFLLEWRGSPTE